MTELLERLLPLAPGTFVDVGVNVGQTLVKVRSLEPSRRYIGLEPNPVCVFYVNELIRANGFSDCTIVPAGLHTDDGLLMLDLYSTDATDSGASLVPGFRKDQVVHARVPVPVLRFDQLAPLLPERIGLVKIDVEGAELEVMQTMHERLQRDRPFVLVEVLPVYSADNAQRLCRQKVLEQIVATLGYAIFRVFKTAAGGFAGAQRIGIIGVHGDLQACDYLLAPKEALARIEGALRVQ